MTVDHILAGKRVLVTGGTGFIGGRLVERLIMEQNARVQVLVRNFSSASRLGRFNIEIVRGDINDQDIVDKAMAGCDIVFHLAFEFSVPSKMLRRNVKGTKNVMNSALKHNVRMVHISTIDVYGWPATGDLDESAARKTTAGNVYAKSKLAVEQAVVEFSQKHSLPVVIIQPTIVYGPYCLPWTIQVAQKINGEKPVGLIDEGRASCNAVYVDDVVDAILLAGVKDEAIGETFLISGAQPITWRAFYEGFETAIGRRNTVSVSLRKSKDQSSILLRKAKKKNLLTKWIMALETYSQQLLKKKSGKFIYLSIRWLMPYGFYRFFCRQLDQGRNTGKIPGLSRPATLDPSDAMLPAANQMPMYQSQVRVRVDKAQRILGYEPRYTFEQGMEITAAYLKWANLTQKAGL